MKVFEGVPQRKGCAAGLEWDGKGGDYRLDRLRLWKRRKGRRRGDWEGQRLFLGQALVDWKKLIKGGFPKKKTSFWAWAKT